MDDLKNRRLEIRLSEKLLRDVEEYQKQEGIPHRNTAIAELIRKGLHKRGK
jgi:metal-responsive CopG/Arc/MetJ family transcriptional regulator